MNEYLLIIRGGQDSSATRSPEEMEAHMQDWHKWMGGLTEQGKFSSGQPLASEGKTLLDGGQKVIDRPLVEGKELIGGYLIIKADSLEAATEISKGCPGLEFDCSVEVRKIRPM